MAEVSPSSWSDLPLELAGMVLDLLPVHIDRVRFAAVCAQWRRAARQPGLLLQTLPLLLVPDDTLYSLPRSERFHLPDSSNYVTTCGKWLFFSHGDSGCFLMDSLSKATMPLPTLATIRLPYGNSHCILKMGIAQMTKESKLVLCSPELVAAIVSVCGSTHIALCRPGGSSWSIVLEKHVSWEFNNIVFHKGKLYTIASNEDLIAVSIIKDDITSDPWVSHLGLIIKGNHVVPYRFLELPNGKAFIKMLYLLESGDKLLMVRRTLNGTCRKLSPCVRKDIEIISRPNKFDVFEPDFSSSQWARVTTIGDGHALFLGRGCSRSVCVSQCDMLGDQIFFLEHDDEGWSWYDEDTSSFCRAYNMRNRKFSSPLPVNSWKRKMGFATWLFP